MHQTQTGPKADWQPLTLFLLLAAAGLTVFVRLMPPDFRPWNLAPAGAMFLFAGARARSWYLPLIPFAAVIALDWSFFQTNYWQMPIASYVGYSAYLLLGLWLLRKSESPLRIGATALLGSVVFFVVTNFAVWLEHAFNPNLHMGTSYYCPTTVAGLVKCFEQALPFYRGTVIGDVVFSGAFFGVFALLSRTHFVAERIVAPAQQREESR